MHDLQIFSSFTNNSTPHEGAIHLDSSSRVQLYSSIFSSNSADGVVLFAKSNDLTSLDQSELSLNSGYSAVLQKDASVVLFSIQNCLYLNLFTY